MDVVAGIIAGIGGVAGVWAILRFAAPYLGKLAGRVLKVREDLDVDRDRIVSNLRAEIGDYQRRITALTGELEGVRATLATERAKNAELTEQVADAEAFIKRYIGEPRKS